MGNRGRVLVHPNSEDTRWVLKDIDVNNSDLQQKRLTQSELLKLEDKLFRFELNLVSILEGYDTARDYWLSVHHDLTRTLGIIDTYSGVGGTEGEIYSLLATIVNTSEEDETNIDDEDVDIRNREVIIDAKN